MREVVTQTASQRQSEVMEEVATEFREVVTQTASERQSEVETEKYN